LFTGQKYPYKLPCGKATCLGVHKTCLRKEELLMSMILHTLKFKGGMLN